jgi:hypothetical protein
MLDLTQADFVDLTDAAEPVSTTAVQIVEARASAEKMVLCNAQEPVTLDEELFSEAGEEAEEEAEEDIAQHAPSRSPSVTSAGFFEDHENAVDWQEHDEFDYDSDIAGTDFSDDEAEADSDAAGLDSDDAEVDSEGALDDAFEEILHTSGAQQSQHDVTGTYHMTMHLQDNQLPLPELHDTVNQMVRHHEAQQSQIEALRDEWSGLATPQGSHGIDRTVFPSSAASPMRMVQPKTYSRNQVPFYSGPGSHLPPLGTLWGPDGTVVHPAAHTVRLPPIMSQASFVGQAMATSDVDNAGVEAEYAEAGQQPYIGVTAPSDDQGRFDPAPQGPSMAPIIPSGNLSPSLSPSPGPGEEVMEEVQTPSAPFAEASVNTAEDLTLHVGGMAMETVVDAPSALLESGKLFLSSPLEESELEMQNPTTDKLLDDTSAYQYERSKQEVAEVPDDASIVSGTGTPTEQQPRAGLISNAELPSPPKRKACEISSMSPEEQAFEQNGGLQTTAVNDVAADAARLAMFAERPIRATKYRKLRRMAEVVGIAAFGGVAVMSALIATAPAFWDGRFFKKRKKRLVFVEAECWLMTILWFPFKTFICPFHFFTHGQGIWRWGSCRRIMMQIGGYCFRFSTLSASLSYFE